MSYMDQLLVLHAVAVIVLTLGVLGLLYALAGLCGLIDDDDPNDVFPDYDEWVNQQNQ